MRLYTFLWQNFYTVNYSLHVEMTNTLTKLRQTFFLLFIQKKEMI